MEMVAKCKNALFGEKGLFYPGSLAAFKKGWQETEKARKKREQKVNPKLKQNAKVQPLNPTPLLVTNTHAEIEEDAQNQDIPDYEQLPPEILWDIAEDEVLDEYF